MQSIVPVPVPQSMQSQDMSVDNGINTSASNHPSHLRDSRTYVNSERFANQSLAPATTDFRAQLAAVISTNPHQRQHAHSHSHSQQQQQQQQQQQHHQQQQQQQQHASHTYSDAQVSSSASPHDHNIDPAIGGTSTGGNSMLMNTPGGGGGGDSGGDDLNDGRKSAKRELSQSKRAAQNRAAQRAFRQRKEGYIKKLEEQVRELHNMNDSLKASQAENYSLREYIIHLQSRLIESQGDFPQPPPNVNLAHPHSRIQQHQHHAPVAPMNSLQANTARSLAAAGLATKQEPYDHSKSYKEVDNSANNDDKIRSQLQSTNDGLSGPI